MCGGKGGSTTTSSPGFFQPSPVTTQQNINQATQQQQTYTPSQYSLPALQQALSQAQSAAATPFSAPAQPVAGFSPLQQQYFQELQNLQGMATPYFQSGAGLIGQGGNLVNQGAAGIGTGQGIMAGALPSIQAAGTAITPEDIQHYMNPFAQAAMADMQKYIFDPQRVQTMGQATQMAGGVGADRLALVQQNLGKTQADALAQAEAGYYQNAAQIAEQQKQQQLAAGLGQSQVGAGYGQLGAGMGSLGGVLGNLGMGYGQIGAGMQGAALQGAGALGAAGTQQQALNQAQLMSQYNQQLAALAYPFQTSQFLAGLAGGLAPAFGGTTAGTGTTTGTGFGTQMPSQPAMASQILGLGTGIIGGLGALGAFGGSGGFGGFGGTPIGPTNLSFDTSGLDPFGTGQFAFTPAQRGGKISNPFADGGEVIPFPMQGPNDFLIWNENVDKAVQKHLARSNPEAQATRAVLSRALNRTGNVIPFHPFDPRSGEGSGGAGGNVPPFFQSGGTVGDTSVDEDIPEVKISHLDIPHFNLPMGTGQATGSHLKLDPEAKFPLPWYLQQNQGQAGTTTSGGKGSTIGTVIGTGLKLLPMAFGLAGGGAVNPFDAGKGFAPQDEDDAIADSSLKDNQQFAFNEDASKKSDASPFFSSIIQQESGWNPNVGTSSTGARGIGQIMPGTWKQYAQPGENINNPADNLRVAKRITDDYEQRWPGDPARQAVAYFSGPGNVAPPNSSTPWIRDASDGSKTVSSYVNDVVGRMGGGQQFAQANPFGTATDVSQYMMPRSQQPYPGATDQDWGQQAARSPWMSLIAAGAKMAGSTKPFMSAVAEGIGAGGAELEAQRKELRTEEDVNLKAQQLFQQAAQHARAYQEPTAYQKGELSMRQQLLNKQLKQLELEGLRPFKIGEDPNTGLDIYGIRHPNTGAIVPINPSTGQLQTNVGPAGTIKTPEPTQESKPQTPPPLGMDEFRPNLSPAKSTAPAMVKGPFATAEAGNIKNIDAQMNKSRDSLDIQRDQLTRLKMDYATVMKDSDKDGFFQRLLTIPGADPETRIAVMRSANIAAMSANKPPPFSQEKVAAMEEAVKIQKTMGMSFAATISPRDAMQMQLASIAAQPGFTQSPQGMQRLIGLYDGLVNQGEARHDFWGRWKETNPRTTTGWEEDFRNKNPGDKFTTRALIENMPNQRAKAALPQAVEHLRANRDNPNEIAKFDRLFNNTSSFFLTGRLDPYAGMQ